MQYWQLLKILLLKGSVLWLLMASLSFSPGHSSWSNKPTRWGCEHTKEPGSRWSTESWTLQNTGWNACSVWTVQWGKLLLIHKISWIVWNLYFRACQNGKCLIVFNCQTFSFGKALKLLVANTYACSSLEAYKPECYHFLLSFIVLF